jgi:hypothetical protein
MRLTPMAKMEQLPAPSTARNFHFLGDLVSLLDTLQRHNTKNKKKIFPEKELRDHIPSSYIHVSVSDLYIRTIGLSILLQANRWTDRGNIKIAQRRLNVETGTVSFSGNT